MGVITLNIEDDFNEKIKISIQNKCDLWSTLSCSHRNHFSASGKDRRDPGEVGLHVVDRERVTILEAGNMDVTNCISQWGIGSQKIISRHLSEGKDDDKNGR